MPEEVVILRFITEGADEAIAAYNRVREARQAAFGTDEAPDPGGRNPRRQQGGGTPAGQPVGEVSPLGTPGASVGGGTGVGGIGVGLQRALQERVQGLFRSLEQHAVDYLRTAETSPQQTQARQQRVAQQPIPPTPGAGTSAASAIPPRANIVPGTRQELPTAPRVVRFSGEQAEALQRYIGEAPSARQPRRRPSAQEQARSQLTRSYEQEVAEYGPLAQALGYTIRGGPDISRYRMQERHIPADVPRTVKGLSAYRARLEEERRQRGGGVVPPLTGGGGGQVPPRPPAPPSGESTEPEDISDFERQFLASTQAQQRDILRSQFAAGIRPHIRERAAQQGGGGADRDYVAEGLEELEGFRQGDTSFPRYKRRRIRRGASSAFRQDKPEETEELSIGAEEITDTLREQRQAGIRRRRIGAARSEQARPLGEEPAYQARTLRQGAMAAAQEGDRTTFEELTTAAETRTRFRRREFQARQDQERIATAQAALSAAAPGDVVSADIIRGGVRGAIRQRDTTAANALQGELQRLRTADQEARRRAEEDRILAQPHEGLDRFPRLRLLGQQQGIYGRRIDEEVRAGRIPDAFYQERYQRLTEELERTRAIGKVGFGVPQEGVVGGLQRASFKAFPFTISAFAVQSGAAPLVNFQNTYQQAAQQYAPFNAQLSVARLRQQGALAEVGQQAQGTETALANLGARFLQRLGQTPIGQITSIAVPAAQVVTEGLNVAALVVAIREIARHAVEVGRDTAALRLHADALRSATATVRGGPVIPTGGAGGPRPPTAGGPLPSGPVPIPVGGGGAPTPRPPTTVAVPPVVPIVATSGAAAVGGLGARLAGAGAAIGRGLAGAAGPVGWALLAREAYSIAEDVVLPRTREPDFFDRVIDQFENTPLGPLLTPARFGRRIYDAGVIPGTRQSLTAAAQRRTEVAARHPDFTRFEQERRDEAGLEAPVSAFEQAQLREAQGRLQYAQQYQTLRDQFQQEQRQRIRFGEQQQIERRQFALGAARAGTQTILAFQRRQEDIQQQYTTSREGLGRQFVGQIENISFQTSFAQRNIARDLGRTITQINQQEALAQGQIGRGVARQIRDINIQARDAREDVGVGIGRSIRDIDIRASRSRAGIERGVQRGFEDLLIGQIGGFAGGILSLGLQRTRALQDLERETGEAKEDVGRGGGDQITDIERRRLQATRQAQQGGGDQAVDAAEAARLAKQQAVARAGEQASDLRDQEGQAILVAGKGYQSAKSELDRQTLEAIKNANKDFERAWADLLTGINANASDLTEHQDRLKKLYDEDEKQQQYIRDQLLAQLQLQYKLSTIANQSVKAQTDLITNMTIEVTRQASATQRATGAFEAQEALMTKFKKTVEDANDALKSIPDAVKKSISNAIGVSAGN